MRQNYPEDYPRIQRALAVWIASWQEEEEAGLLEGLVTSIAPGYGQYAFIVNQKLGAIECPWVLPANLEAEPARDVLDYLTEMLGHARFQVLCDSGRLNAVMVAGAKLAEGRGA